MRNDFLPHFFQSFPWFQLWCIRAINYKNTKPHQGEVLNSQWIQKCRNRTLPTNTIWQAKSTHIHAYYDKLFCSLIKETEKSRCGDRSNGLSWSLWSKILVGLLKYRNKCHSDIGKHFLYLETIALTGHARKLKIDTRKLLARFPGVYWNKL